MVSKIRKAQSADMENVLSLIKELAEFEKEADEVEVDVSLLKEKGFGNSPEFTCFVADYDSKIIGIALVYNRFSTWKGTVLHLEDLIVSQEHRGKGIGTMLLDEVVKFGNQIGVKRISWEVLDWNEQAIKFYDAKGADVKRDWNVVHLNSKGIKNYLSNIK